MNPVRRGGRSRKSVGGRVRSNDRVEKKASIMNETCFLRGRKKGLGGPSEHRFTSEETQGKGKASSEKIHERTLQKQKLFL